MARARRSPKPKQDLPPADGSRSPRRRSAPFRPHGTIALFWFAVFFVVFGLLLVAPGLVRIWREVPTGPEQQQEAFDYAREAVRPRLILVFLLALAAAAVGVARGLLPGARGRP